MNKVWSVVTLNFDMPTKTAKWGNVTLLLHSNVARFETKNKASHTKWPPIQIEIRCFCSSWIIYKNNRIRGEHFFFYNFIHDFMNEIACYTCACFSFLWISSLPLFEFCGRYKAYIRYQFHNVLSVWMNVR